MSRIDGGHLASWSIEDLRDECLDGADCLYDPVLHDGPDQIETPQERAAREQVAKEVCGTCPVWDACLEYAVRVRPKSGVWAGFTAAELAMFLDADPDEPFGEVA